MPEMDKTGPYGTGPIGRGGGPCGSGIAFQRGGLWEKSRRFWHHRRPGWCFFSELPVEEEKSFLEKQKSWLKARIDAIDKELEKFNQPGT
jgi:hypothetical protein